MGRHGGHDALEKVPCAVDRQRILSRNTRVIRFQHEEDQ